MNAKETAQQADLFFDPTGKQLMTNSTVSSVNPTASNSSEDRDPANNVEPFEDEGEQPGINYVKQRPGRSRSRGKSVNRGNPRHTPAFSDGAPTRQPSASRPSNSNNSSSRTNTPATQNRQCHWHSRFGADAFKCSGPRCPDHHLLGNARGARH